MEAAITMLESYDLFNPQKLNTFVDYHEVTVEQYFQFADSIIVPAQYMVFLCRHNDTQLSELHKRYFVHITNAIGYNPGYSNNQLIFDENHAWWIHAQADPHFEDLDLATPSADEIQW